MIIIRWLALLPLSVIAALVTYYLSNLFARYSLYAGTFGYLSYDTLIGIIYTEAVSNGFMGFAFVYTASQIAPSKQKEIAFAAISLILLFTGGTLFAMWFLGSSYALKNIIASFTALIFCFIGALIALLKTNPNL